MSRLWYLARPLYKLAINKEILGNKRLLKVHLICWQKQIGIPLSSSTHNVDMDSKVVFDSLHQDAVSIFSSSINSVLPHQMINKDVQLDKDGKTLRVGDCQYELHHNVYVVGFGKAVSGMARAIDDSLSQHIVKGIISIPIGSQQHLLEAGKDYMVLSSNSKIKVMEGSKDNMPDENSYKAAVQIQDLISKLNENDILIVLISGGGSALLPLPIPPVTLEEEMQLTKLMSNSGATIDELNILRKNIEQLKGGGLAKQARPAKVIALIISDVIRDKLDIIASGPTVPDKTTPQQCQMILKRLRIQDQIPESVTSLLGQRAKHMSTSKSPKNIEEESQWSHVQNLIIGNNKIALNVANEVAEKLGYLPIVLNSVLDGDSRKIGVMFGMLARYAALSYGFKSTNPRNADFVQLELDLITSGVPKVFLKKVVSLADHAYNMGKPVCIITGGETTIHVKGTGKGGRNQEMAVACALEFDKQCQLDPTISTNFSFTFLSGGTDGQDGPTPTAGAVLDNTFIQQCREIDVDPMPYIQNNDTFNLIQKVNKNCLINTGPTGTNVMDIQILIVKSKI